MTFLISKRYLCVRLDTVRGRWEVPLRRVADLSEAGAKTGAKRRGVGDVSGSHNSAADSTSAPADSTVPLIRYPMIGFDKVSLLLAS